MADDPAKGEATRFGTGESVSPIDLRSAWYDGIEPMQWLAQPWIARGEIHNIIADSGVGKSLLALDIAIGLAIGGDILGGFAKASAPVRVAYVDRDSGVGQTKRRILSLLRGRFPGEPSDSVWTNLFVYSDTAMMLHGHGFGPLQRMIAEVSPAVIFFDALRALHDMNEDSSRDMAGIYRGVLRPIASLGHAVVVLHHEPKPSERLFGASIGSFARGSTEIPAAADTNIRYRMDNKLGLRVLEMGKARNIAGPERPKPLAIGLMVGNGSYRITGREL